MSIVPIRGEEGGERKGRGSVDDLGKKERRLKLGKIEDINYCCNLSYRKKRTRSILLKKSDLWQKSWRENSKKGE